MYKSMCLIKIYNNKDIKINTKQITFDNNCIIFRIE